MRQHLRAASLPLVCAALVAGCAQPQGAVMQRLDPTAPAAIGYLTPGGPSTATPLTQRPPFGLYAEPPTADTLAILSTGTLSPDHRFRFSLTTQGLWVARVDGAWLWHVGIPAALEPVWTYRTTLMVRSPDGAWHEADPVTGLTARLADDVRGKDLHLSADGRQLQFTAPGAQPPRQPVDRGAVPNS